MDRKKYQSKTLIAEYQYLSELEDFRYSETAYKFKDGRIVIEYDGKPHSLYGLRLSFTKSVGRKGIFSISRHDYESWKSICKMKQSSFFVDWEEQIEEQLMMDHETVLKCVGENELPF